MTEIHITCPLNHCSSCSEADSWSQYVCPALSSAAMYEACRSDCSAGGVSSFTSYISCICSSSWSSNSLYTGFSCVTCSPGSARGSTFRSSICNSWLEQSLFQYPEPVVSWFDSLHEGIIYKKSVLFSLLFLISNSDLLFYLSIPHSISVDRLF